jgi:hypothetical protein
MRMLSIPFAHLALEHGGRTSGRKRETWIHFAAAEAYARIATRSTVVKALFLGMIHQV